MSSTGDPQQESGHALEEQPQLEPIVFTMGAKGALPDATFKVQELRTHAEDKGSLVIGVSSIGGKNRTGSLEPRRVAMRNLVALIFEHWPEAAITLRKPGIKKFEADQIDDDPITSVDAAQAWIGKTGQFVVLLLVRSRSGLSAEALVTEALRAHEAARDDGRLAGPGMFDPWLSEILDRLQVKEGVLLSVNPGKPEFGFTEADLQALVEQVRTQGSWTGLWKCNASVPAGTPAFLVRKGGGENGVVAAGELLSAPALQAGDTEAGDAARRATVRFDWAAVQPPEALRQPVLERRFPRKDNWSVQQSGTRLQPHQADAIRQIIDQHRTHPSPAGSPTRAEDPGSALPKPPPARGARARVHLNLLLEGVPGTGKTWWVNGLKAGLERAQRLVRPARTVTLHPSSGYEEFVEGLRPPRRQSEARNWAVQEHYRAPDVGPDRGGPWFWEPMVAAPEDRFVVQDGFFVSVCAEAAHFPYHDFIVMLDEINRCNIPKVLGDLLTTLESSKRARWDEAGQRWDISRCALVSLPYSGRQFFVPDNVLVIATMNSSDRSVVALDAALRRRFATERAWPLGFGDERRRSEIVGLEALKVESITAVPALRRAHEEVFAALRLPWPAPTPADPGQAPLFASVEAWLLLNAGLLGALGPDAMLGHSYLFDLQSALSARDGGDDRWWCDPDATQTAAEVWRRFLLPQLIDAVEAAHAVELLAVGPGTAASKLKGALEAAKQHLAPLGTLAWGVDGSTPLLHRARITLDPVPGAG